MGSYRGDAFALEGIVHGRPAQENGGNLDAEISHALEKIRPMGTRHLEGADEKVEPILLDEPQGVVAGPARPDAKVGRTEFLVEKLLGPGLGIHDEKVTDHSDSSISRNRPLDWSSGAATLNLSYCALSWFGGA